MKKTTFSISKMYTQSEISVVLGKLELLDGIKCLAFYLHSKTLEVFHTNETSVVEKILVGLNLDSKLLVTISVDDIAFN